MPVICLFVGFRTDNKGCGGDKFALEVLSRSATNIGGAPVLANESLCVRVVHRLHEGAFGFRRHGRFADAKGLVYTAKELRQLSVADFVGLDPTFGVVPADPVPDDEIR